MKLWQKVYLMTIFLFVAVLNSGMYLVFDMTYQKDLAAEQERAESEYNMISAGILQNLQNLAKQKRISEATIQSVLEICEKYYIGQKIHLTFWKENQCIYPKENDSAFNWNVSEQKIQIRIQNRNRRRIIQIQSMLYENNGKYYLQYEKKLSELDTAWEQLQRTYLFVSVGFSMGLAGFLFFLLRRVMNPIRELTQTVDEMRSGNLSARVEVRGSDEIAVLSEHVNEMAEKLRKDILQIQKDAQAKQDFVDNFAHELKSPITSIYGFAEYIQKANVSEQEVTECMEFIMNESTRLLNLSYTLLDMSKMRDKKITMQSVLLRKIFDGIRKSLEQKGEEFGVALEFRGGGEKIYGNEILLQSLLYNLIHNGICACQEGGKVIVVSECIQEGVRLTVEDNGCGISAKEIDKITEPFYRVDKARNRSEGRTGLGLSLCKQIAALHEAEIAFLSEENRGTKVIVFFRKSFTHSLLFD